jgi:uncharacterized protein YvpB
VMHYYVVINYSEYCITFDDSYSKSCITMAEAGVTNSLLVQARGKS